MRVVLYARVSTEDTEDQDPEAQLRVLRSWATQRGWRVVGEFSDRVSSDPNHKKRRRRDPPGLARAIRQIEERHADVLAVFGADRLVAGPIALLNLVSRVQDLGGQVSSYRDGRDLDTTTDHGELQTFMDGWFNRMRLRLGRAATKAGIKQYRDRGLPWGRPQVQGPPLEDLVRVEQDAAAQGKRMSLEDLAEHFGVSEWAIRCVKNPGLRKRRLPDGPEGPKEGV